MRQVLAKLGYVHRRNWERDPNYRVAFVAGPPPLAGAAIAAVVWTALHAGGVRPPAPAMWAHWKAWADLQPDQAPVAIAPSVPLPARDATGWTGWPAGWNIEIRPVTLTTTEDVLVSATTLSDDVLDGPAVELDRIVPAGPDDRPFIGVDQALLAIPRAGTWDLSLQAARNSDMPATCLIRSAFSGRRLVSSLTLSTPLHFEQTSGPFRFDLVPGLYWISVAFGCWHDGQTVGPGRLSVLLRGPGETEAAPATADLIVRRAKPG